MAKLPDISDLVDARIDFEDLRNRLDTAGKEIYRIENEVVQRYKSAGIAEEDCNHPVVKYQGMGENECSCCGKRML